MESNHRTLEEAHAHAQSRGGTCLAESVESIATRLTWRCALEHEFEASIRLTLEAGYWCPTCFPRVDDPTGWDYDKVSESDPLLARFHTQLRYRGDPDREAD